MNIASVKNRGYFKIKGASSAFNFVFKDKIVLDIGSSTGGFTQYALDQGAKKVIAVEKGTNQMQEPLRSDPRVELYEKTDIFEVGIAPSEGIRSAAARGQAPAAHGARPLGRELPKANGPAGRGPMKETISTPNIILADVSFISLTKILKYAKENLAGKDTEFLVMLKPQFEADDRDLKDGIIKNETIRRNLIKKFEQWLKNNGFVIINKKDNDLHGKHGNVERFYYLRLAKSLAK